MADNLVGGIAYFKVDGTQYSIQGGFKVQPNTKKNKKVVGVDGSKMTQVTNIVPYMEGVFFDLGSLAVKDLQDMTSTTVTVELNNKKTYILINACYAGDGAVIDTTEGHVPFRFEGDDSDETTAG